jgi:DNA-binding transcriptional LysR family regulator
MTATKNPLMRRCKLTLAQPANEPCKLCPSDSFFGSVVAEAFRANGHEPPRLTVTTLSFSAQTELLAIECFLTVLPSFMLRVPSPNLPLKALPVALPNSRKPIGIITLNNRTLTPLAQLFIDTVRAFAKPLAKSQQN